MKVSALFVAGGIAAAALAGCQVSGDSDVDTTRRPSAGASVSTDTTMGTGTSASVTTGSAASYTMTAEATRDTEWAASNNPSATRGTIRQGDTVMFGTAPSTSMEWQQARLSDGTVRYVRPTDFRMRSR